MSLNDNETCSQISEQDEAFVRGVAQAFIVALKEKDLLYNVDLFPILTSEAEKFGCKIAAHQCGIHGIFVVFEPL